MLLSVQSDKTYKLLRSFCALSFQTASRWKVTSAKVYRVPTIEHFFVVQ